MSWQNLLVEFLLMTAGVIPEETKVITAESTSAALQAPGLSQVERVDLPQPTRQTAIHKIINTTTNTGRTLQLPSDEFGIYRVLKSTEPARKTTPKFESNNLKTTIPILSLPIKTPTKTTNKQTAQPSTPYSTNPLIHSVMTSHPTQRKTMAPRPTALPVLTPKPFPATTGAYSVFNGTAQCIKAQIGLTMMVKNSQTNIEYLNIDPNVTHATGVCGNGRVSITISFQGGYTRFQFTKNGEIYFVSVIEASLAVPSEGSVYSGIKMEQLFSTPVGSCFKCLSRQTVELAGNFQLWMVNTQLQAFDIVGNQFGKENECTPDRNKTAIPVAVGLSLAGLLLIVSVTLAIYRRNPHRGYDRI